MKTAYPNCKIVTSRFQTYPKHIHFGLVRVKSMEIDLHWFNTHELKMDMHWLINTLHARRCAGSASQALMIIAIERNNGGKFEINPPTPTARFDCIPEEGLKVVMSWIIDTVKETGKIFSVWISRVCTDDWSLYKVWRKFHWLLSDIDNARSWVAYCERHTNGRCTYVKIIWKCST